MITTIDGAKHLWKYDDGHDLGENSAIFRGVANGRWTYENNLRGAFGTEEERRSWCGSCDALDVLATYNALLLTLKDNPEAYLQLTFTECEPGMNFIGKGWVSLQYDAGSKEVETRMDYEVVGDVTIGRLIDYGFASDVKDAKEYLGLED